ncbi:thiamine phosphate synthase [Nereida sp. MMG025]|uniref:thiamine phosphate synthase n=1 Tax=Nereida sp. MMG025 TaxID=2909981 RepID=UPI001F3780C4|nr:thiamine phosphate synthase [Nereida sp. MMG025]MCF6443402.1 thiamine phosphate synthase [Nereida sp. MMG025]
MTDATADEQIIPQVYLTSPPQVELSSFANVLADVLDAVPVACFRLALSGTDEDHIARVADATREICHARDVAIVIEKHLMMVERLGLDGVHLTDGARSIRYARKELGDDAIVGTFCGTSRHDGMSAGEASADYAGFGPVGQTPLGDGSVAETELFQWWSEMIEVPCIAEGALDLPLVRQLAPYSDFFGLGDEIWASDDPVATLKAFHAAMV